MINIQKFDFKLGISRYTDTTAADSIVSRLEHQR